MYLVSSFIRNPDGGTCFSPSCLVLLTAEADARSTIEREISPAGPQTGPPLGAKRLRIITKDCLISVHRKDVVDNQCALLDKQRLLSISAAADGQRRVSCRLPRVGGYDGMQTQCYSTCQRMVAISFFLFFSCRGCGSTDLHS